MEGQFGLTVGFCLIGWDGMKLGCQFFRENMQRWMLFPTLLDNSSQGTFVASDCLPWSLSGQMQ